MSEDGTIPDRQFVGPALVWTDNGCEQCRARWERDGALEPRRLGAVEAQMSEYSRCGACGAYWEAGYSNPHEIPAEQARLRMPEWAAWERAAGLG